MKDYDDSTHQVTTSQADFSLENRLTYEKTNFDFAFAVRDESELSKEIETRGFVEFVLATFELTIKEDGKTESDSEKLSHHKCTEEDV